MTGTLKARAPFDFAKTLQFIDVFSPCAGEQCIADGAVSKAVMLGEQTVAFRVSAAPGGVKYALASREPIGESVHEKLRALLTGWLGLQDDLGPFYEIAEQDPKMAAPMKRWRGMHHVRFITPFEIAAWAVMTQRTPIRLARKVKDAVTARFGGRASVDGQELLAFPSAQVLARAPQDELDALLKNSRRSRFLRAVTEAFVSVDESWLRRAPFDDVEAWLRDIDGIGEWSSAFILFRGLGRCDRMPFTAPMENAARKVYGPLPALELERICKSYGAAQGYWALYTRA